jgi:hypothetical protein
MNTTREEALFALALEKPAEKRAAFLDVMCEGDAGLRQRLEALLAAHEQPDAALATAAPVGKQTIKLDLTDAPDEAVGQTLGRYKLLERVGEGGWPSWNRCTREIQKRGSCGQALFMRSSTWQTVGEASRWCWRI